MTRSRVGTTAVAVVAVCFVVVLFTAILTCSIHRGSYNNQKTYDRDRNKIHENGTAASNSSSRSSSRSRIMKKLTVKIRDGAVVSLILLIQW